MATSHELIQNEVIESATGALQSLLSQQRRELDAATSRLREAVAEHANLAKSMLRSDVMDELEAVFEDLDRQLVRDHARGDLFVGTTSLTDLPHALRVALARAERAANRGDRGYLLLIDRLPVVHAGADGGVHGHERTRPRAFALVDVSEQVFD